MLNWERTEIAVGSRVDECCRVYKSRDDAKKGAILCNVNSTTAFVHLAELFVLCGTRKRCAIKVTAFLYFYNFLFSSVLFNEMLILKTFIINAKYEQ